MSSTDICLIFLNLFLFNNITFAKNDSLSNNPYEKLTHFTARDVRAGERIFHGQIPSAMQTINCASCHNVDHIDTFNWSPSARDLALKYKNMGFTAFKTAITQPTGKVMTQIHDNLTLSDEQIHQLKSYLADLAVQ